MWCYSRIWIPRWTKLKVISYYQFFQTCDYSQANSRPLPSIGTVSVSHLTSSLHRNTFIYGKKKLTPSLQLKFLIKAYLRSHTKYFTVSNFPWEYNRKSLLWFILRRLQCLRLYGEWRMVKGLEWFERDIIKENHGNVSHDRRRQTRRLPNGSL